MDSDRYPRISTTKRAIGLTALAAVVAALLAWLIWVMVIQSDRSLVAEVAAFRVTDEHTVEVLLQTEKGDDVEGHCQIRARAEDHTIVGELVIQAEDLTDGWYEIRTGRRATSVESTGCQTSD